MSCYCSGYWLGYSRLQSPIRKFIKLVLVGSCKTYFSLKSKQQYFSILFSLWISKMRIHVYFNQKLKFQITENLYFLLFFRAPDKIFLFSSSFKCVCACVRVLDMTTKCLYNYNVSPKSASYGLKSALLSLIKYLKSELFI